MKFISLFAGVGGFDLALERAGHECVYANEWDKYCKIIYDKHFSTKLDGRSITEVSTDEIPDHDLLVGGFPCQAFSIAGKRKGFDDTRGTLFFDIARILRAKQPRLFLLENVKGLLSHDGGRTFSTIISALDELGYDLQWQVLNSKNHGVPQNRERVFIVGHLRGTSRPQVFPLGEVDDIIVEKEWEGQLVCTGETEGRNGDCQHADSEISQDVETGHLHQVNQPSHSNDRVYGTDGVSPTLNTMQGGRRQPLVLTAPNGKKIDLTDLPEHAVMLGEVRTEKGKESRREIRQKEGRDSTARGADDKKYVPNNHDQANCLTTAPYNIEKVIVEPYIQTVPHGFNDGWRKELPNLRAAGGASHNEILMPQIRRLTPLECERLQGFPDGWTEGVSDTQRYKMMGNAVTVNVVEYLLQNIK